MKNSTKLILLIVVFILILAGAMFGYQYLSAKTSPDAPNASASTDIAKDFTVYDYNGNAYKLSDFFGKPIVLNFWATWCGPCQAEMPSFQKAYEKYSDNVVFLMVNLTDGTDETVDDVIDFIKNNGYTFPVYCDTEYSAAYAYSVYSIPKTVFINKDGSVLTVHSGMITEERLNSYIDAISESD